MSRKPENILLLICITAAAAGKTSYTGYQKDLLPLVHAVQKNSQQAYSAIQSVSFKGFSRAYIYFGYSPLEVDMVPVINEYYYDGFWMKPDSLRIVVRALRDIRTDTTQNRILESMPLPNPFHFTYDASALGMDKEDNDGDEDIVWPLYPFAPGADSLYRYVLENEIGFGDNVIYVLHVEPKRPDFPAVTGTFMVDVYREEVVGSDVQFTKETSVIVRAQKKEGTLFRLLVKGDDQHRVKTEKQLLYSTYWLPMQMEEEFLLNLWGMNVKIYRQLTFDSYLVNPEEPDTTLLASEKIVYRRDPLLEKELFPEISTPARLSQKEQEAIVSHIRDRLAAKGLFDRIIGSEDMAREAGKMALEKRFGRTLEFAQALGRILVYNRVEGLRLQGSFGISQWPCRNASVSLGAGYGLGDKRWKAEAAVLSYLNSSRTVFADGAVFQKSGFEESRRDISTGMNSFTSLLYKGDYRDYFYQKGVQMGVGIRPTSQTALKVEYIDQTETGARVHSSFSLLRYKNDFRINPEILEGQFRGLCLSFIYSSYRYDGEIRLEHTDRFLKSDFSFRSVSGRFESLWPVSQHSDLRILTRGAWSWGAVPPQRWFDIGGRIPFNYHGHLRGLEYKSFTGDRMASGIVEYTVKGGALAGWMWQGIRALKLTVWGGLVWSSLSEPSLRLARGLDVPSLTASGIYYEAGMGIGDILNILRLDLVWRRHEKSFLVQISLLQ